MTYWALNIVFLGVAALVGGVAVVVQRQPRWRAVGLAAIVLMISTAIFDNVLVATGIVGYSADRISGVFVGVAPLEDFSYAVAALVLLPSLWHLLGPRPGRRTPGSEPPFDRA